MQEMEEMAKEDSGWEERVSVIKEATAVRGPLRQEVIK